MQTESQNLIKFKNPGSITDVEELLKYYNVSGRLFKRLLKNKSIIVNGIIYKDRIHLKKDDEVGIIIQDEEIDQIPEKMELDIIYEDDDILAINKPPFTVVHPTKNISSGTLSNGVAYYFKSNNLNRKIRIVNRLDRDTSGVIIFAKNSFSHQQLAFQMEENTFKKYYIGVVQGRISEDSGTIALGIENNDDGPGQKISQDGKKAITHFKVLKRGEDYSVLSIKIDTGRTHQIRVHLNSIGHPIIGDSLYGKESSIINRQALHAYKVYIKLPRDGEGLSIIANIPEDMNGFISRDDLKE